MQPTIETDALVIGAGEAGALVASLAPARRREAFGRFRRHMRWLAEVGWTDGEEDAHVPVLRMR